MNKKILAVAIAGALSAPSAFAATDTSGMQYTSASEGFYASMRLIYNSGEHKNAGGSIDNAFSRIGVSGSNDLGGGLEGFYGWEMGVNTDQSADNGNTRIAVVGLRGGFGQIRFGSFWTSAYSMTYGSTDVANIHSGNISPGPGRGSQLIEYTSPDLNGFQGAIGVQMSNSGTSDSLANGPGTTNKIEDGVKDENDLDHYLLTAKYEVQGFSAAIGYLVDVEALDKNGATAGGKEDLVATVYKLGYSQDNWYVNGWYSADNAGDHQRLAAGQNGGGTPDLNVNDTENLSIAAGVEVGKVNLYALYEAREQNGIDRGGDNRINTATNASASAANNDRGIKHEDERTTFGVQYNLGARSRVWVEYAGQDLDSNEFAEDYITIGLRHDF